MDHITNKPNHYWYGNKAATVTPANGVKGIIIRTVNGGYSFRVYHDDQHNFTDYDIRHDNLTVTIDVDELAAFYEAGERYVLDHSPEVLGLKEVE